jgi:hypothetical protein
MIKTNKGLWEEGIYRSYVTPHTYYVRSKNAVFFNTGSTWLHEVGGKATGAFLLHSFGDIPQYPKEIVEAMKKIDDWVENLRSRWLVKNCGFITEACPTKSKWKIRRDLVNVADGTIYEFETDQKRAERHEEGVVVIKLWLDKIIKNEDKPYTLCANCAKIIDENDKKVVLPDGRRKISTLWRKEGDEILQGRST